MNMMVRWWVQKQNENLAHAYIIRKWERKREMKISAYIDLYIKKKNYFNFIFYNEKIASKRIHFFLLFLFFFFFAQQFHIMKLILVIYYYYYFCCLFSLFLKFIIIFRKLFFLGFCYRERKREREKSELIEREKETKRKQIDK